MRHSVIEEIIETNRWRDGEFAKLKINSSGVEESLWCRMSITLIYAHWEGFVVSSLKILIEHLNSLNLEPKDATTNLVVIGLGDKYKSLSGKQSFQQKISFTDRFNVLFDTKLKLTTKVNTKSNLRSDVLEEICQMFPFDYQKFDQHKVVIDKVVSIRNSIAHGENSYVVNMGNVTNYMSSLTAAMDTLLDEIDHFLQQKKYLKVPL
ncbi:MAE_28990/MAE_18760 family HEPN-like nuclease [Aeromonas encheleia]